MDSLYIDNIQEALVDQGKIVSYKWLSLHLGVKCNMAKQMLYDYFEQRKNSEEDTKIIATYLISGTIFDKALNADVQKVCVVSQDNLETMKSLMKNVYSLHIYSLQCSSIKDMNIVSSSNYDKIKENLDEATKFSAISFPALTVKKNTERVMEKISATKEIIAKDMKVDKNDKKKGSISSLFNKAQEKEKKKPSESNIKSEVVSATKEPEKISKKQPAKLNDKKQNRLSGFFVKMDKKPEPANQKTTTGSEQIDIKEEPVSVKEEEKEEPVSVKEEETSNKEKIEKNATKNKQIKSKSKPPSQLSKPKKRKNEQEMTSTKRQRILQLDSSDSSSDEEMDDENPLPPSPPRQPSPTVESDGEEIIQNTPQETNLKPGKRRVKKMVDKTYMDDDGYLVTKKEYEFVSESDDEDPIPAENQVNGKDSPKENVSPTSSKPAVTRSNTPKKKSTPKKKALQQPKAKQSSIMNFFTKK